MMSAAVTATGGYLDADEGVSLSEWLDALRAELSKARRASEGHDIRFAVDAVNVEFEVISTRSRSGHGGVRFWVLEGTAEGKRESSSTQRVQLSLRAVGPDGDLLVGDSLDELPD
jgi:hypothetical protein